MELKTKQEEISKNYNDLVVVIKQVSAVLNQKQSELLKIEGELRLINDLIENEVNREESIDESSTE